MSHVRDASDVISRLNSSDPAWTGFTYTYGLSASPMKAIEASVWAFSCASVLAMQAASVPLVVQVGGAVDPTHELQGLLDQPARDWTRSRLISDMTYALTLKGASYLEKRRASALDNRPVELWSWYEGQVSTILEGQRTAQGVAQSPVASYYEKTLGGITTKYLVEDMIRTTLVRPGEPGRGLGSAEGAQTEISIDRSASGWQQCAFANRGVPDGVFASTEYLTEDQMTDTETRIDEKWTGVQNAHRPFLLGADLKWLPLARTAAELEYVKGREFTRESICSSFGVPGVIFSSTGAVKAQLEAGRLMLWERVSSILDVIVQALNTQLSVEYGDNVKIVAETSGVLALASQHQIRWEAAATAINAGVPWSQINRLFDLGLEEWPGWDEARDANAQPTSEPRSAPPNLRSVG